MKLIPNQPHDKISRRTILAASAAAALIVVPIVADANVPDPAIRLAADVFAKERAKSKAYDAQDLAELERLHRNPDKVRSFELNGVPFPIVVEGDIRRNGGTGADVEAFRRIEAAKAAQHKELGLDVFSQASDRAKTELEAAIQRLEETASASLPGVTAKLRVVLWAIEEEYLDFDEPVLQSAIADLERLAKGGAL